MVCPRETLPFCLNVTPECFCSEPGPPVGGFRKESVSTSPPQGWPFQEKLPGSWPFYFTPLPPPVLCSIKGKLASRPREVGYFETLVCRLLSQLALQIKSYALPRHLVLWFCWPVVLWAERASTRLTVGGASLPLLLETRTKNLSLWEASARSAHFSVLGDGRTPHGCTKSWGKQTGWMPSLQRTAAPQIRFSGQSSN